MFYIEKKRSHHPVAPPQKNTSSEAVLHAGNLQQILHLVEMTTSVCFDIKGISEPGHNRVEKSKIKWI